MIAEDQYLAREGTRRLLEEHGSVKVVGSAQDRAGVLEAAGRLSPDVVLMDIRMPPTYRMEGIEAAHLIKAERPSTGILVLTQHDDEEYVWALQQLFADLKARLLVEAPPQQREAALERFEELEEALVGDEADPGTAAYVKRWFRKKLPTLAGMVTGVLVNPIVGKLVHSAGDAAMAELDRLSKE